MAKTFDELKSKGLERVYPAGQMILYQGDQPQHLFIIKSGHVKIYDIDSSGNEQFLFLLKPGDAFPMIYGFMKTKPLLYFYGAFDEVTVQMVPRENYIEKLMNDRGFAVDVLDYFVDMTMLIMRRVEVIRNGGAGFKVGTVFIWLIDSLGKRRQNKNIEIPLRLTHQDIANMCGLTRETTSLQLKALDESGIIKSQKSGLFMVNATKLQDFLEKELATEV